MVASQLLVISALALGATPRGVVYDFSASWCGPCQQMSPLVSKLERQGLPIHKVDIDQRRDLASKYGVKSIPAFVLVIDGKVVDRVVGVTSESRLRKMCARIPKAEPKDNPSTTAEPKTLLVSNQHQTNAAPRQNHVKPRSAMPRTRMPFLGEADDEPAGFHEPTVRANGDDLEEIEVAYDSPASETANAATPMDASVRIRANNGTGVNYGSGTVISSGEGRTMVLTCGHICRGMKNTDTIEVDFFSGGEQRTHRGRVIAYDEKADVGLLGIPTDIVYPCVPVAAPGRGVKKGDAVASVGCGGGDNPTLQQHQVISLNRYLGPDNIECSGEPIEGRSGGGLFAADGTIVGVCFARDPQDHRGLYAGLKPIQELLHRCGLSHLYKSQPQQHQQPQEAEEVFVAGVETGSADAGPEVEVATEDRVFTPTDLSEAVAASETPAVAMEELPAGTTDIDALQAALSKVGEAEVVCVVRPIKNPRAASRVVILNRASDKFVRYLTDEMESDPLNNRTMLRKPSPNVAKEAAAPRTANPVRPTAQESNSAEVASKSDAPRRYRRRRAD